MTQQKGAKHGTRPPRHVTPHRSLAGLWALETMIADVRGFRALLALYPLPHPDALTWPLEPGGHPRS